MRRKLIVDDEMGNTPGLVASFYSQVKLSLPCYSDTGPTRMTENTSPSSHRRSLFVVERRIFELEMVYSIILTCLCDCGRPEGCHRLHV